MELVKYNYNGVMMTQKEICEKTGISPSTMCNRLHAGMSVDEAVAKGRVKTKITHFPPKSKSNDAPENNDIYETDSSGQKRKKWGSLHEPEVFEIRKKCKSCKYANIHGQYAVGCDYFFETDRFRRCDPRDCEQLGFYEYQEAKKRRRQKPMRFGEKSHA